MSAYTLVERVTATLKVMGLRPVVVEEAAPFLNKSRLWDPQGNPWTPATLRAYLDEHNIRPEVLPDMAGFEFGTFDGWNARSILRAIDRGPDETEDALRQAIIDDPAVRRDVIEVCAVVNDNPYEPGLYRRWLDFARRHDEQQEADHEGPGTD